MRYIIPRTVCSEKTFVSLMNKFYLSYKICPCHFIMLFTKDNEKVAQAIMATLEINYKNSRKPLDK